MTPALGHRDGATYDLTRDYERLNCQQARVFAAMADGIWRSFDEIAIVTGDPPPSISARLRDLRKMRFGGHTVNRRYEGGGLWVYQVLLRAGA